MSISKLPNGRLRCQVYDPNTGRNVSVAKVLGLAEASWPSTRDGKRAAMKAREQARELLERKQGSRVLVKEFAQRWTSDALYARPKESTNIHNRERIKKFVDKYGDLPMTQVDDRVVGEWLAGGNRRSTIPSLCAMWNDARSAKSGRLVESNPWASLRVSKGKGNAQKDPPSEEQVWSMVGLARELVNPSFSAWLQVAAFTGMRPGELDALRWSSVDLATNRVRVVEQFNAKTLGFTAPKNGKTREILLPPQAREALIAQPRGEFCFTNLREHHWTPSGRAFHWKAVRAKAGLDDKSLYLCTRHFAGWYMVNVLEMDSEDVAFQLGHEDGGELVRKTYGHRDRRRALDRLERAFAGAGEVRPLRVVEAS